MDVVSIRAVSRSLWREVGLYVAAASAPVGVLAFVAHIAGGLADAPWVPPVAMLMPMVAAIVVQRFVAHRPILRADGLGIRIGRLSVTLLAFPIVAALVIAAFAIGGAIDPAAIKSAATLAGGNLRLALPDLGGPFATLGVGLLITIFIAPVVNLPLMLGEEVGWRGFLTPRLVALLGKRGVVVAGVIWAAWHLPMIALGYNYPQHPVLGFAVFVPLCVALSILFTAFANAGRSVLAAAIAHGVLNQVATFMMVAFVVEARWIDWLQAPTGLAALAVFAGPAAWIYVRRPDLLVARPITAGGKRGPVRPLSPAAA